MGHIAEALKLAERQQTERNRLAGHDVLAATQGGHALLDNAAVERPPRTCSHLPRPSDDMVWPRAEAAGRSEGELLHDPLHDILPGTELNADWKVDPTIVAIHDKTGSVAEQYRAIRTWLLCRARANERTCLAITSSVPGEGKTVTTANLAVVMAEIRRMRVLALDCDLRQGELASRFCVPGTPGLVELLSGQVKLDEVLKPTPLGNLFVLPAGQLGQTNPTELLNSTSATRVFDEIRERFHYTLVDTPPVQRVSDVGVIGALCSAVVVVVRLHRTATHLVRQSVQWLQSNQLNVMGSIATGSSLRDAMEGYCPSRNGE